MKRADKAIQTTSPKVFICRREETPLQDFCPQMNFEQKRVLRHTDIKVEEFILDQIGSMGIEMDSKQLENCYIRNLIYSPRLFVLKQGKLDFHFEHHANLIAQYLGKRRGYLELRRLIGHLYMHRSR